MLRTAVISLFASTILSGAIRAADPPHVFELREDTAVPGKLNMLQARLRDRMGKLFEKHGITHVGTWVPVENVDNKIYYLLGWSDRKSRELSLAAWKNDPAITAMMTDTDKDGKLLAKSEAWPMVLTDYSPVVQPEKKGNRIFELRIYTIAPGQFENLDNRFRNHTLKLFANHGITNIGYWTPLREQGKPVEKMYSMLAHPSLEAAKKSNAAFQSDPAWVKVKADSEKKAGGPLTTKDGIKSIFLKPTDDSPLK